MSPRMNLRISAVPRDLQCTSFACIYTHQSTETLYLTLSLNTFCEGATLRDKRLTALGRTATVACVMSGLKGATTPCSPAFAISRRRSMRSLQRLLWHRKGQPSISCVRSSNCRSPSGSRIRSYSNQMHGRELGAQSPPLAWLSTPASPNVQLVTCRRPFSSTASSVRVVSPSSCLR